MPFYCWDAVVYIGCFVTVNFSASSSLFVLLPVSFSIFLFSVSSLSPTLTALELRGSFTMIYMYVSV